MGSHQRNLIRPSATFSTGEGCELSIALNYFTLLLWRSCREATDEVPLLDVLAGAS
jgi:hypothetical protein